MKIVVDKLPGSQYKCLFSDRVYVGYLCRITDSACNFESGKCTRLITFADALAEMVSKNLITVTTDSDIDPGFYITRNLHSPL